MLVEVVIVVPTLKRGLFAPNFSNPLCCILTGIIPLVFSIVIIEPLGLLRCMLNSIEILKMLKDLSKSKNSKTLTRNSWGILVVDSVTRSELLKRGWINILLVRCLELLLRISTCTHQWKVCVVLLLMAWRAWWSTKWWLLAHLLLSISLTFINRFVNSLHYTLMAFFIDQWCTTLEPILKFLLMSWCRFINYVAYASIGVRSDIYLLFFSRRYLAYPSLCRRLRNWWLLHH